MWCLIYILYLFVGYLFEGLSLRLVSSILYSSSGSSGLCSHKYGYIDRLVCTECYSYQGNNTMYKVTITMLMIQVKVSYHGSDVYECYYHGNRCYMATITTITDIWPLLPWDISGHCYHGSGMYQSVSMYLVICICRNWRVQGMLPWQGNNWRRIKTEEPLC